MANFLIKVHEFREKIISEFNSFRSYHNDMDKTVAKNLDDLLCKVKYQIDQLENVILSGVQEEQDSKLVLETDIQNTDALIRSETLATLTELNEKIIREFHTATDQIGSKNLDTFVFNLRYQIDQMKNDILTGRKADTDGVKDIESQKAEALIKLQSLAASITCFIMNLDT